MASLPSHASWHELSPSEQTHQPIDAPSAPQIQPATELLSNDLPKTQFSFDLLGSTDRKTDSMKTQASSDEVRTCWICQQDSTDDIPGQEWRTPCPCSLTAHDECLLEWITSEEAPKPGDIATTHLIACPQCKAPIKIQRPRDFIVLSAGLIQSLAKTLVIPTALSAFLGCFYTGFLVYGVNTLHVVFGAEDATRILEVESTGLRYLTGLRLDNSSRFLRKLFKSMDPFLPSIDAFPNWKQYVGLPMIAPALILSRTKFAERIFAVLPITYFLFRPTTHVHIKEWPPSPSLTFAVLPYIRSIYNEMYTHAFSGLERKWDAAVQRRPREGETQEQIEQEQHRADNGALFDLEVEIRNELDDGNGGDWEQFPAGDNAAQQPNQAGDVAAPPGGAALPVQRREARRNWSTGSILGTAMGALFFPAISAAMGDLLKYTLPPKLVGRAVGFKRGSGGLLQEKWGRTVVGGCLFVVLKDAIVLYCKWRKAKDFGKKKVLDYVGKRSSDAH